MKLSCKVIEDMLPMYYDGICSEESVALVDEHLKECPRCSHILSELRSDISTPKKNVDDIKPLKKIQKSYKKMKRHWLIAIVVVLLLIPIAFLVGTEQAEQKEYGIRIVVPAGNQGEFVYSEEEISPRKSQLDIKSIDMSEDAEFVLKPVEETQENAYKCTNFPKGEPMLIDVEKGAWYKIGVAMENPTDEDIVVVFHVVNAKVRVK